jgi:3-methyladenine DNA glycosylase AlkC
MNSFQSEFQVFAYNNEPFFKLKKIQKHLNSMTSSKSTKVSENIDTWQM